MSWVYLVVAGAFEVVWAVALKYSDGFSVLGPSVVTLAGMGLSFLFLTLATRDLPIGTAYAVWTGIGALGTAVLGMVLFAEPASAARIAFLGCILVGIVGLKLVSG